jgi:hypothetical protein
VEASLLNLSHLIAALSVLLTVAVVAYRMERPGHI